MQTNHFCECCGSSNTEIRTSSRYFPIPFSDTLEYKNSVLHCNDCGEDVDLEDSVPVESFLSTENPQYTEAIQKSIDVILSDFQQMEISQSHIERSFGIPARTLSKWRNDRNLPSAAALSFLRILRTFPWLLNVAEKNFNKEKSHRIALKHELQSFFQEIEEKGIAVDTYFSLETNCATCKIEIKKDEKNEIDPNKIVYNDKIDFQRKNSAFKYGEI